MLNMKFWVWMLAALLSTAAAPLLHAADALPAKLNAVQDCAAVVSIRKQTNPDRAHLQPGRSYRVLAANKQPPSHYRIRVPGAEPVERWVAVGCLAAAAAGGGSGTAGPASGVGPEYVLALSWQPAFCQTGRRWAECRSQTARRFDADHFVLHGLWPQPRNNVYCGVSMRERNLPRSQLPAVGLSAATRAQLKSRMPGSRSRLDRHEWLKHGTCYGKDAEHYFRDSLALLRQVNDSGVRQLFVDNIGSRLTAVEIRAEFDRAFGRGTGAKVAVNCKRGLITELHLSLRGAVSEDSALAGLLSNAADTQVRCAAGRVDAVGW